jgi:hypothetical protein
MKDSTRRDPRVFIIPSDQEDFPTAVSFVNALIRSGILVHKAVSDFTVAGKKYPSGSYIIKTAQSFRPHVIDMFEPQDHPNDFQYPGGPPIRPYDVTGWTLAFQMGIKFDRILDGFEGPFQKIKYGEIQYPPKLTVPVAPKAGYLLSPQINNSFIVINDLIKAGIQTYRLSEGEQGNQGVEPGSFYIPSSPKAWAALNRSATEFGVRVSGIDQKPAGGSRILPARIAIFNKYGGLMSAGWISWIMEQFHFPYEMIYSQSIDSGSLRKKYDVIIFTSSAIPSLSKTEDSADNFRPQPNNNEIPEEFRRQRGSITAEKSIPQLQKFMEEGGIIITLESSTNLAYHLKLPVKNALLKINDHGQEVSLAGNEFYIPGSLLTADINTNESANWGMPARVDFNFDQNPVFKLEPGAYEKGITKLAWFSDEAPLHSGWAWGQKYLKDGVIAFVAPVGAGKLFAFSTDITFRSQSHCTFKLLFNQFYQYRTNKSIVGGK